MFDLSREWITLECPGCGYQDDVQLIDVKNEAQIFCPNCKQKIDLHDEDGSVNNGIDQINQSMRDLENLFKNFGK